jgi:nitrogen fixation/metabolism regulation signal transduction histidine kinase
MLEVNDLGQTLREQRLGGDGSHRLLRTVMAEIDVAVFAFDGEQRLRLVNRAGERLLAQPSARVVGPYES